jgi:D-proline reductase (dithiol) PrdB
MSDQVFSELAKSFAAADDLRSRLGEMAFTRPKPLATCTVAVLTSAGLHTPEQDGWGFEEQSFRLIERERRDFILGQRESNFDRAALAIDFNVVFPLDRLEELARDNVIGAVAPRHVSFMGAISGNLSTIRMDTGPAAASALNADGVDVVVLTPV